MSKPQFEHCTVCHDETGRAGRSDDSLYLEGNLGAELGPLCPTCHDRFRRDDLQDQLKAEREKREAAMEIGRRYLKRGNAGRYYLALEGIMGALASTEGERR